MEPEGSLLCSQEPSSGPYPEPDRTFIQRICPDLRPFVALRNKLIFYDELLAPRPTPKLEGHSLSAVRYCSYPQYLAAVSSIRNLRTLHAVVLLIFTVQVPEIRRLLFLSCSIDSAVGTPTGYGMDGREIEVRVPVAARFFSLRHVAQTGTGGPPSLLSNGYWGLFPRELSGRGVKLTVHLQPVPNSTISGSIHPPSLASSSRSA
jgi:hypothetical protein